MVIEMLLNNDIKKQNCSNDFTVLKGNNVIMYIIEKKINFSFNHFIWTKC
jgi:hypothetical protein